MSHPYIPQGTPITVTSEGWWDGYHNGNEPYLSYVGHDGLTKKMHIPHGARVDTHPEKSWPESFTIDKTPKAAEPKLRTDTGEPLDTDDLEPLYQAANDREIAAMFPGDSPRKPEPGDSPRKPEPGDRVRVTYEAEYHEHADDGHFVRPNDLDFPILTPSDVEITVIEPARPAVPEDPKRDVDEVTYNDEGEVGENRWEYANGQYHCAGYVFPWVELWEGCQKAGSKLYPVTRTRGPVIGG